MARCVTCGVGLHPERAKKYDYCLAPDCQQKNAKPLTIAAVGMNKAADEIVVLDERTRAELAEGRYRDQRRVVSGPDAEATGRPVPAPQAKRPVRSGRPRSQGPQVRGAERRPWTRSQEKLALLYNEQGQRPGEIARKLGVSAHLVTQIILAAKNRAKT